MITIHPQYITDTAGKKLVVLPVNEFNTIMEELEELEDIRLYDEAKKEDNGERVPFADYLKSAEQSMNKYSVALTKKAQKQLDAGR